MFNWFSKPEPPSVIILRDPKDNYRIGIANNYITGASGWTVENLYEDRYWRQVCIFNTKEEAFEALDFLIKQGK